MIFPYLLTSKASSKGGVIQLGGAERRPVYNDCSLSDAVVGKTRQSPKGHVPNQQLQQGNTWAQQVAKTCLDFVCCLVSVTFVWMSAASILEHFVRFVLCVGCVCSHSCIGYVFICGSLWAFP